ncbi:mitochondrial small ribosomal subunit protein uS17m [Candidatus Daviesbacteria bacterium]|nr:mitochondrial small ribosomal subunit protein uS17m [Candidatus Daviesbacteria bacterium]
MIGRVISTKMQKTAVVVVEGKKIHPLYKKAFVKSKKYLVDNSFGVKDGDLVEISKVAPVSKNKHWRVTKVVGKNLEEITKEHLQAEAEKIVSEVMPGEKETEELSAISRQTRKKVNKKQEIPKKEKEQSDS